MIRIFIFFVVKNNNKLYLR